MGRPSGLRRRRAHPQLSQGGNSAAHQLSNGLAPDGAPRRVRSAFVCSIGFPEGLGLTAEGRSVYATAQEMERASHSLRAHLDQDLTTRGMVRCSVTEGLGTMWILPHLAQFSRTHPSTIVDLRCSMEVADVLRMEADVAVQLDKPDRLDVKAVRLGRLHVYPFASKRYVETYGLPKDISEFKRHRLVHQQAPQVAEDELRRALDLPSIEGVVALRTNVSTALASAIEFGIGIGPLPTYIVAIGTDLIPLDIGLRYHVDIWMTYHPDARSVRRVSHLHRLAADVVRSEALSVVRRRIHSSERTREDLRAEIERDISQSPDPQAARPDRP